jgi:hypothetical protein
MPHKSGILQVMFQLRSVPVLSDVVVTLFSSIIALTLNEFLDCAIVSFSERYDLCSNPWGTVLRGSQCIWPISLATSLHVLYCMALCWISDQPTHYLSHSCSILCFSRVHALTVRKCKIVVNSDVKFPHVRVSNTKTTLKTVKIFLVAGPISNRNKTSKKYVLSEEKLDSIPDI